MVTNDAMTELLSSLEHIVLAGGKVQELVGAEKDADVPESKRIREVVGMQIDEFALALGVSVSSVKSWEAQRTRPSGSAQRLMQIIHSNPYLGRQLLQR